MGLDEYLDQEEDDDAIPDKGGSSRSDGNTLDKFDSFKRNEDGELERKGLYGYSSREEYEETIVGEIEQETERFKFRLPIFPHIEIEEKFERGKRYKLSVRRTTTVCASQMKLPLARINREIIMIDCGSSEKEECLEILRERFGEEVGPDTEVVLYFFAKTRHIVKMAMGDELNDTWGPGQQEYVLNAVYNEDYTLRFLENDSGELDHKHPDHIEEW